MEMEQIFFIMEISMSDSIKKESLMELGCINGVTVTVIKDLLKMD